jgi:hypothetical protein
VGGEVRGGIRQAAWWEGKQPAGVSSRAGRSSIFEW